jgi:outer membrane protein OmpA-like peptidoglycan-associated protein
LNFFAAIDAVRPPSATTVARIQASPPSENGWRSLAPRFCAWLPLILALGACSSLHPAGAPAKPAPRAPVAVAKPGPHVTDPSGYEQEKARIKRTLAGSDRDSLAPSEVGYYMDVLLGRLKQNAGKGVSITRQRDSIVVSASVRGGFGPGADQIAPGLRDILAPLARTLLEYRKTVASVRIANDAGGDPRLADQRASAVARYLISNGIAGKRILIAGSGVNRVSASKPATGNDVRVDIQIEPAVRAAAGAH